MLFSSFFFFFNDTATTEIYTLSLHDALPIWRGHQRLCGRSLPGGAGRAPRRPERPRAHGLEPRGRHQGRSEEHTSELQSRLHLVCRLLLEKKKQELHTQLYELHAHLTQTQTS